jgi:hypothetical protein
MDEPRSGWGHPATLGLLGGWLTGMLWWIGLITAFFLKNGHVDGIVTKLIAAPLAGLPWAMAGLVVGAVYCPLPGYLIPAAVIVGTIGGGIHCSMTRLFDGWLALTMPVYCIAGAFVGLIVGIICELVWRLLTRYVQPLNLNCLRENQSLSRKKKPKPKS